MPADLHCTRSLSNRNVRTYGSMIYVATYVLQYCRNPVLCLRYLTEVGSRVQVNSELNPHASAYLLHLHHFLQVAQALTYSSTCVPKCEMV